MREDARDKYPQKKDSGTENPLSSARILTNRAAQSEMGNPKHSGCYNERFEYPLAHPKWPGGATRPTRVNTHVASYRTPAQ